jgi:23S rRNA (cytosine1962-C5)-methyltransferase
LTAGIRLCETKGSDRGSRPLSHPKSSSPAETGTEKTAGFGAPPVPEILICEPWEDYALLDSGGGRKLERFGRVVLDRPDAQALWGTALSEADWARADARFLAGREEEGKGRWEYRDRAPESWPIGYRGARIEAELTGFRHLGIFPEHRVHWDWAADRIDGDGSFQLLNLFGYTGVASLVGAAAGAKVTHVDASKKAIGWARANQEASGLGEHPIRWICEDAAKFVAREVRRGNRYDGIILDPPKYGRGPKNEIWRLDEQLGPLMADCAALLDDRSGFLILSAYATHLSPLAIRQVSADALSGLGGSISFGEMTIRDTGSGRLLPTSMFVRWQRGG